MLPRMRRAAHRITIAVLTLLAAASAATALASCDIGQSTGNGFQHVSNSIP